MTFDEVLDAVEALLRERGRVTYRGLRRRFELDEAYLQDVAAELISARRVAREEDGEVLAWVGEPSDDAGEPRARLPHGSGPEAERRHLTVMFCDLTGSTALSSRLDPEEWREVIRGYHEACSAAVGRYDGHVAQYLGDGVLIYFGYPSAHDDDAIRAVHAGLAAIEGVAELGRRLGPSVGALAVRVGVHSGLVVIGELGAGADRKERLALGDVPNVAARIQGEAAPHELVVSEATQRLLGGTFKLAPLGAHTLRGVEGRVQLWRVQGVNRASDAPGPARPSVAPLVGRREETAILEARFEQAAQGEGQLVAIAAEAGLGKSRLVHVLRERLRERASAYWEWRCSAYHVGTPLHPVVQWLRHLLAIDDEAAAEEQYRRIHSSLQELGLGELARPDLVSRIAVLLGCPVPAGQPAPGGTPQQRKRRTLQLLVSLITLRAQTLPVCLAVEDLHWADPSTRELLDLLIERMPSTSLLLIVTLRPQVPVPSGPAGHVTQLALSPLSAPEIRQLATQVAAGRELPAELIEQLAANTDGVPLFIEELTTTVLEAGLLEPAGDAYVLTRPISTLGIPSTLQGSLMARLDHLSSVKSIAQLASVLGREFPLQLLVAVAELPEEEVAHELQRLVSAGVLRQRGELPRAVYVFRHALIQEAAYQSLLKSSRQRYHSRVATALHAGVSGSRDAQPEQLARHHEAAGEIDQAIEYMHRAGIRSAESSAMAEAVGHLGHALGLLERMPECAARNRRELRLRLSLGAPLIATRGYASSEVAALYARARTLSADASDPVELFEGLWGLFLSSAVRADFGPARQLAEVLRSAADRAEDQGLRIETSFALAHAFWTGGLDEARQHCERGLREYDPTSHAHHAHRFGQDPEVSLASYLSWIELLAGNEAQAREASRRALARARERGHSHSLGFALAFAGVLEQMSDQPEATLAIADELIEQSIEHDHPTWLADGDMLRGWAVARRGDMAGLDQLQRGLDAWDALGARLWRTHQMVLLADASLALGELDRAEDALRASAEVSVDTGEVYYNADAARIAGLVALRRGVPRAREVARAHFEQGLALARSNGSLGLARRLERQLRGA